MEFNLVKVEEKNKEIIYNLMQLYIQELSMYEDETTNFKLLDNGLYEMSPYIALYWKEENRHPYILKCNNELAGFVLYRYNENNMNEIAEFFIINKYKRVGAGTFMANSMFKKYKGKWEIRTLRKNERAQSFWRNVINKASNGNFKEQYINNNTRYAFYFEN